MSLSKVRFSLFCIAFEELTAHLQAGICPSAQSKAPCAPVLVVPYWIRKQEGAQEASGASSK